MNPTPRRLFALVLLLAPSHLMCSGGVQPDQTLGSGEEVAGGSTPPVGQLDGGGRSGVELSDIVNGDPAALPDGVSPTSLLPRLTYAEYDRTVSDLLYLDVTPSVNFPEEVSNLEGYLAPGELAVNDRLRSELARTATELAGQAVGNAQAYAKLVTCDTQSSDCSGQFIQGFGQRAYRRPLTDSEGQRFSALFAVGPEAIASGNNFSDGVQLVIEAILQSPKFLYRIEQGQGQDALGIPLTDHEIATRLSYLLIGSTPDAELLAAADRAELNTSDQIQAQATRLFDGGRIVSRVLDFHDRWMNTDGLLGASKDAQLFPEFSEELVSGMLQESRDFVREVTVNNRGGVRELLTAPYTVVGAEVASIYGMNELGGAAQRVDFAADSPRAGLLTQPAFLAAHSSSSVSTSPILRSIFTLRRIMCFDGIPDPPANVQSQVPTDPRPPAPATTRQLTSWTTSLASCGGCHSIINPIGFAFEEFDAIGRFRTTENGVSVDASGRVTAPAPMEFNGVKDLAAQIAALPETRACYARNWFRYANGRLETSDDLRTLARITQSLAAPGFGARDTLSVLTQAAAFTHIAE